jgi:hypothetical protein
MIEELNKNKQNIKNIQIDRNKLDEITIIKNYKYYALIEQMDNMFYILHNENKRLIKIINELENAIYYIENKQIYHNKRYVILIKKKNKLLNTMSLIQI